MARVNYHMKKNIIFILMICMFCGCSSMGTFNKNYLYNLNQRSKLASAKDMLSQGKRGPAINLLSEISNGKGVPGVTDEAIFMLALIYLNSSHDVEKSVYSLELLKHLQSEYPASLWALQSSSILGLLIKTRRERESKIEIYQEINFLKLENKRLKLNIERLKTLDLELEDKSRH